MLLSAGTPLGRFPYSWSEAKTIVPNIRINKFLNIITFEIKVPFHAALFFEKQKNVHSN
jgi:hypothetical protein